MIHFTSFVLLFISLLILLPSSTNAKLHKIDLDLNREELEFEPTTTGFLINGQFERLNGGGEGEEVDQEIWLCFDYSFDTTSPQTNYNQSFPQFKKAYPSEKCGGVAAAANANPFWFALRAHWFRNGSLMVDFVNALDRKVGPVSWSGESNGAKTLEWKLAVETEKNAPNTIYFNGLASAEIPPMSSSTKMHVRLSQKGQVQLSSISTALNPVTLDQLPKYHLLSEILRGNEIILMSQERK